MSIQLMSEKLKPLMDLDFYRPNLSYQSRFRYSRKGMRSADGKRFVRLEAVKVGARWLSSQAAVDRLIAAVNEPTPKQTSPEATPSRTPSQRQAENERSRRVLDAEGV